MLPSRTRIEQGQRVVVRAACELAGARPRYTFDVSLAGADGEARLGDTLCYPEASLNVNDAMDVLMDQMAP